MKKLLLLATTTFFASSVYAGDVTIDSNDLKLQLLGRFNFQGGYAKQSKVPNTSQNISNNRKNFAFDTNAFTAARVSAEYENIKYGAQIALAGATRFTGTPVYDRSHIFLESDFGKAELGSSFSSAAKMTITSFDIARATGDDGTNYFTNYMESVSAGNGATGNLKTPSSPGFFLDSNNLDQSGGESSRKVTYYTPEFAGFQLGVSFIPDSSNLGRSTIKDASDSYNNAIAYTGPVVTNADGSKTQLKATEYRPVKDAYTVALSYKHDVSDTVSFKVAAAGEYGKAAKQGTLETINTPVAPANGPAPEATTTTKNYKLAKLNTYNFGGILTIGNYSLAASYGNLGKSMTSEQVLGNKRTTTFITGGASYVQGPVGVSLVYSKAKQYGNKMDIYVLGTDYKLAPGLLPYAEVAYFNGKAGLPAIYKSKDPMKKFKGWVFVAGAKLAF